MHIDHVSDNGVKLIKGFHGSYTVSVLSGPAYLEKKWSCCGEAVARLQGLCIAATALCAVGAGHLIFVIVMN